MGALALASMAAWHWDEGRHRLSSALAALAAVAVLASALCCRAGDDRAEAGPSRWTRWAPLAAWALCAALFTLWSVHFIDLSAWRTGRKVYYSLFDDGMISMRYAWNLAHGHGLVWNPGERVEGFTNPLMVFLMAVPAGLLGKSAAVHAIQLGGIAFVAATALATMKIAECAFEAERAEARATLAVLAALGVFLYYPYAYWALMGMETGLLGLLMTLATWTALRTRHRTETVVLLPVLLGLMFWTRPDSLVQASLLLAFRALSLRRSGWRALAREAAILAAFVVSSFVARRVYYGAWLPNTYTLKMTGLALGVRLECGWAYTSVFLKTMRVPLALAGLGLLLAFDAVQCLLVALFLSVVAYQIWVGGDPWLYWRILCPYVLVLFVAAARGAVAMVRGAGRLAAAIGEAAPPPAIAALGAGAAIFVATFSLRTADAAFRREMTFREPPYLATTNHQNTQTGLRLARICDPDARIGVLYAGTLPYYAGTRAIDFLGKADAHIAHLRADPKLGFNHMKSVPGHNKYDLKYSIGKLLPDYVQQPYWGHDDMSAFVRRNYVNVRGMWLRRGSPHIHWDRVRD